MLTSEHRTSNRRKTDTRAGTALRVVLWGVGCMSAAAAVRHLLDPILGNALPYLPAIAAIALASWSAGWQAGLLCAVLSQLWINYFFIPPRNAFSYNHADLTGIVAFYTVTVLVLYPTELARRASKERGQALERLQIESSNKSHFLALLAHELRGPVHTAKLALELADGEDTSEERRHGAHAVIRRQIENVERLSADLMDTAKTEQGKLSVSLSPATVADLLARAVERSRAGFEKRDQHVQVVGGAGAVRLNIDLGRMVQVVSNLLDNASKYSPDGTTVLLEADVSGDTFSLKVKDEGRGFDPKQADQLFEPFFQVSSGSEGLGLGLPLVRKLVHLHGGRVSAFSAGIGMGATFEVRLPGSVLGTPFENQT